MSYFTKTIYLNSKVTREDAEREVELQTIASRHWFTPNIISVERRDDAYVIQMEKVTGMSIADFYNTDPKLVPEGMWEKMRMCVRTLLEEDGIEYVDITGYNFMGNMVVDGDDAEVYIIDFGHAQRHKEGEDFSDPFLGEFLAGKNKWNPKYL